MKQGIAALFAILLLAIALVPVFAEDAAAAAPAAAETADTTPSLVPTEPQPPAGSTSEGATTSSLDQGSGGLAMSLKSLDFSEARLSLAGPNALYIREVKIEGSKVSLLFRKGDQEQWKLVDMIPEDKNFFPQGLVLDFARLSKLENGSLEIDGIILDGHPYRTVVQLNDDNSLSFNQPLQAGSFVGASVTKVRPIAELALKDELAKLNETERLNQDMLGKIGSLEGSTRTLSEDNLKLKDQIKELGERRSALETEVSALRTEIETLKADKQQVDAALAQNNAGAAANPDAAGAPSPAADDKVSKSLDQLLSSIDKLSGKVSEIDKKLANVSERTNSPSSSADLLALQDEIKRLTEQNQKLMNERQDIEQKLRAQYVASGYIQIMKPLLDTVALSGFGKASSKIGNWKVTSAKAAQVDGGQYFAQLNLPLVQKKTPMLYSFDAKSTGKGWAGLGLHIYAQSSTQKGYGHGKSLLVWLTRDPDYYRNNRTYLQLYKSDDDINMGRVLDSSIQESISSTMHIDVLYQPVEEYLTVSVNGVEKIRYKTWFGISSGVEVALRTLDSAEFSNLEVRTAAGK